MEKTLEKQQQPRTTVRGNIIIEPDAETYANLEERPLASDMKLSGNIIYLIEKAARHPQLKEPSKKETYKQKERQEENNLLKTQVEHLSRNIADHLPPGPSISIPQTPSENGKLAPYLKQMLA